MHTDTPHADGRAVPDDDLDDVHPAAGALGLGVFPLVAALRSFDRRRRAVDHRSERHDDDNDPGDDDHDEPEPLAAS